MGSARSASAMSSALRDELSEQPLAGRRVAFVGKLGGMTRREAQQLVRRFGGIAVDAPSDDANLVVIGADELPLGNPAEMLDDTQRDAVATGRVEVVAETDLWQRLGLVEPELHATQLYTPAMLADLLGVPVAVVRRWHRRGLIAPAREVRRLPYFDFREVARARQLAKLLAAGASPASVERQLAELARWLPEAQRPLAQLSIIVEGRRVLLRQGAGLIDAGGQMQLDFDAAAEAERAAHPSAALPSGAALDEPESLRALPTTVNELCEESQRLDEEGDLPAAAETLRAALAFGGPKAELCFELGELLYRLGDLTAARERYYMAIELDEEYVEARANLGCVLVETGELELAAAAFRGALSFHHDYPDVHYHLARVLDELGDAAAGDHWRQFLALAPDSPWADEARLRLGDN